MFVKNSWYVAAWSHELIDDALVGRTLLNEKVLLYRGRDDKVVAIEDRCCHRGAALSMGRLEGNCVRCMYHGLLFDSTGACVQIPGQKFIPPNLKVKPYRVVDTGRLVWIWMGDIALADESKIPDFAYLKNPEWHGRPDYLHYDANYLLIADNLADFNHVAYVHTNTLGGSERYAVEHEQSPLEKREDGFKLTKWHMNSDLPPFVRKVEKKMSKVDRWNTMEMKVPAFFYLESGFSPAGNGLREGNREGIIEFRNFQAMTPETDRTTHFFWVYMHNQKKDIELIGHSLHDSILEGFYEDKAIIETQQKVLDADPTFKLKAIAADAPLSHLRWLIEKRIKEENVEQAVGDFSSSHPDNPAYFEWFSPPAVVETNAVAGGFEIKLNSSGRILHVPENKSILETLEDQGYELSYSCREGMCRTCETGVIEGVPDHRDYVLSGAERAAGRTMMICVSRATSAMLVLDI